MSEPPAAAMPKATPAESSRTPQKAAYYYKVRWGFQHEFERLFFKNHYPVLMAQKEAGRIKDVEILRPTFHGDGRADWTFEVLITFSDWAAFHPAPADEEAISKRLFADQEAYKRREQRRFELLDAHWDVALTPVLPPE